MIIKQLLVYLHLFLPFCLIEWSQLKKRFETQIFNLLFFSGKVWKRLFRLFNFTAHDDDDDDEIENDECLIKGKDNQDEDD